MHIKQLKVRPRKRALSFFQSSFLPSPIIQDLPQNICGPQLATMLGCWAATNDLHAKGPCMDAAQDLYNCMRTTVSRYVYILCYMRLTTRTLVCSRKAAQI